MYSFGSNEFKRIACVVVIEVMILFLNVLTNCVGYKNLQTTKNSLRVSIHLTPSFHIYYFFLNEKQFIQHNKRFYRKYKTSTKELNRIFNHFFFKTVQVMKCTVLYKFTNLHFLTKKLSFFGIRNPIITTYIFTPYIISTQP